MGSAALLAACGSESSSGSGTKPPGNDDPTTTGSPTADVADGFVIARRFPDSSLTPGSLRLPVSLASTDQTLFRSGPDALTGNVLDEAGSQVASFTAPFHGTDLVIPYWSIKVQVDQAGHLPECVCLGLRRRRRCHSGSQRQRR